MLRNLDLKIIVSQATFFSNRVPAPEGVILSFARPKESIQRKGRPDTAYFLRAAVVIGGCQMGGSCPIVNARHPLPCPLRAIPEDNVSARRGIRELWLRCA
jgi:hypothetical protein